MPVRQNLCSDRLRTTNWLAIIQWVILHGFQVYTVQIITTLSPYPHPNTPGCQRATTASVFPFPTGLPKAAPEAR